MPAEWRDRTVRLQFEGVYRDARRVRERRPGGAQPVRLLRVHDRPRPPPARRADERGPGRGRDRRRQPVVLRRRHPPQRVAAACGTGSTSRPTVLGSRTPEIDDDGAVVDGRRRWSRNETPHTRARCCAVELLDGRTAPSWHATRRRSRSSRRQPPPLRRRLFVAAPARWGPSMTVPVHVPRHAARRRRRRSMRTTTTFGIRVAVASTRSAGCASTASTVDLRGACVHHDNGPLGAATHRPSRGAPGRAAQGGRVQRHPQRPQPDEPGDARRLRPARRCS